VADVGHDRVRTVLDTACDEEVVGGGLLIDRARMQWAGTVQRKNRSPRDVAPSYVRLFTAIDAAVQGPGAQINPPSSAGVTSQSPHHR
jgi:hypothetical protein